MATLFPKELLLIVADYLDKEDHGHCALVCKDWHALFMPLLFRNVDLPPDQLILRKFLNCLRNSEARTMAIGHLVRRLDISETLFSGPTSKPSDFDTICCLCPNLSELSLQWCMANRIMALVKPQHLTYLGLTGRENQKNSDDAQRSRLFELLGQLPHLRSLVLHFILGHIRTSDLDLIHDLTQLEYLELKDSTLDKGTMASSYSPTPLLQHYYTGKRVTPTKPAQTVRALKLYHRRGEINDLWMDYIATKYPRLHTLDLTYMNVSALQRFDWQEELGCMQLPQFDFPYLSNVRLVNVSALFHRDLLVRAQQVSVIETGLGMDYKTFQQILDLVPQDKLCELSLSLPRSLEKPMNRPLPVLTHLTLTNHTAAYLSPPSVKLDSLLSWLSLRFLSLDKLTVEVEGIFRPSPKHPLRHLRLDRVTVMDGVMACIKSCGQLRRFTSRHCRWFINTDRGCERVRFDFSQHHMELVDLARVTPFTVITHGLVCEAMMVDDLLLQRPSKEHWCIPSNSASNQLHHSEVNTWTDMYYKSRSVKEAISPHRDNDMKWSHDGHLESRSCPGYNILICDSVQRLFINNECVHL